MFSLLLTWYNNINWIVNFYVHFCPTFQAHDRKGISHNQARGYVVGFRCLEVQGSGFRVQRFTRLWRILRFAVPAVLSFIRGFRHKKVSGIRRFQVSGVRPNKVSGFRCQERRRSVRSASVPIMFCHRDDLNPAGTEARPTLL